MASVVGAVPGPGIGKGIECHPDGAVADGVHVNLKSVPVERHRQILERCGIVDRGSGVSFAVEIGSQQRRGAGLDHAVGKELHRGGSEPGPGKAGAQLNELGKQAVGQGIAQAECRDHSESQRSAAVGGGVGPQPRLVGRGAEDGGDAEAVGQLLGPGQTSAELGVGARGHDSGDQGDGLLAQRPAGFAGAGIALDPAVGWIGRRARDPGEGQRFRVHPGGMAVGGVEEGGAVGHRLVQQLGRRVGVLEDRQLPPAAPNPGLIALGPRAASDAVGDGRPSGEIVEGAFAQLDAGADRVHVPVLEAGQHHLSSEVNDFGVGTEETRRETVAADVHDPAVPDCHGAGPASGGVHGVDAARRKTRSAACRLRSA